MRTLVMTLLLMFAGPLFAQETVPGEDASIAGTVLCEPGTENSPEGGDEASGAEQQDCIDLPPDEDFENEDFAREASVDEEFTPGDEISEDYPVPLPADI
jgi:hypothetical protein